MIVIICQTYTPNWQSTTNLRRIILYNMSGEIEWCETIVCLTYCTNTTLPVLCAWNINRRYVKFTWTLLSVDDVVSESTSRTSIGAGQQPAELSALALGVEVNGNTWGRWQTSWLTHRHWVKAHLRSAVVTASVLSPSPTTCVSFSWNCVDVAQFLQTLHRYELMTDHEISHH